MAAFLIDLDGTVVKHGTNELLPGRIEQLVACVKAGHELIYLTRRGQEFPPYHIYGVVSASKLLKQLDDLGVQLVDGLAVVAEVHDGAEEEFASGAAAGGGSGDGAGASTVTVPSLLISTV